MKRSLLILITLLAATLSWGQDVRTLLQQEPDRYANILHSYEAPEVIVNTPAPKGDVLVKLLRNERETTIPALKPYKGPYYRWKDLRNYFVNLP